MREKGNRLSNQALCLFMDVEKFVLFSFTCKQSSLKNRACNFPEKAPTVLN